MKRHLDDYDDYVHVDNPEDFKVRFKQLQARMNQSYGNRLLDKK